MTTVNPMAWTISLIFAPLLLVSQAEGQCTEGDVRLEDGSRQSMGRVGVCIGERWGTVCDDLFGNDEASVVCYQLGYSRFGATALNAHGGGSGPILMDNVQCSGTECRLIDCPYLSLHNCFHYEDVAVQCNETARCIEGDIRLADGAPNVTYGGRVEVCTYEQWSSLCSETWTAQNTRVVCRQLGYKSTGIGTVTTLPGGSDLVVYQQQFACSGDEERIIDCSSSPLSSPPSCTHDNDVTILCSSEELCSEGAVRLAGGTEMNGRVEVCVDSEWGTVCDDLWDNRDARVVCRQLGFSGDTSTRSYMRNQGTGPIHMDDVQCTGSELTLVACPHNNVHNCIHFEDAQVNCQPLVCENWEVRLVGSNSEMGDSVLRGRVEICWNETWGTVCDRGWSLSDATVVCRELGFSQFGVSSFSHAYFGQGSGPVLVRDVACDGTEYALFDCGHSAVGDVGSCTHASDAGASCQMRQCEDGDIRLVDGLSQYEGRLEFCSEDMWGTVCDDFWSESATHVACRQLGFASNHDSEVTLGSDMFSVPTTLPLIPILLDNVVCSGTESKIVNCDHNQIGRHNCGHFEDVNIRCGQCTEYDVRLVDGESENEGRVEVCVSGRWGTVCDDNWDTSEAVVVCRQLGLPTQGALTNNVPPNHNLSIVMDRVTCNGEESSLGDCDYLGSNALRQCTHNEDAGVRCSLVHSAVLSCPNTLTNDSLVIINCETKPLTTTVCSFDGGPQHSFETNVPQLQVFLINDSPRVTSHDVITGSVAAEFNTSRPVTGIRCYLRSSYDRKTVDCLSGSVIFSGLTPGLYVLKIHAYNRGTDAVVVKRAFMMTSDPNFCSVVLINRGVVVSENGREATIEVNSYGLANTYTCRLDNEPEFECSPPMIELNGLVRGRHRLTVTPDCEMKKALTLRFTS